MPFGDLLAGPGMDRQHDWVIAGLSSQEGHDSRKCCLDLRCFRRDAVSRPHRRARRGQAVEGIATGGNWPRRSGRASYMTSPILWTPATMPSRRRLSTAVCGRAEQQRADVVGQHAVDFLGHAPVEGPQPRLEVGDRIMQLGGRECAGQCRIRVARHQDEIRQLSAMHHAFERLPAFCRSSRRGRRRESRD